MTRPPIHPDSPSPCWRSPSCSPRAPAGARRRRPRRRPRRPSRAAVPHRRPSRRPVAGLRLPRGLPDRAARRRCGRTRRGRDDHDRPGRHRDRGRRPTVADRRRQLRGARRVRLLRRRRVPPPRPGLRHPGRRRPVRPLAERRPNQVGTGGPPYTIQDEPVTTPYKRGTVAMARTPAPNSVGLAVLHRPRRLGRVRAQLGANTIPDHRRRSRPAWRRSTRSPPLPNSGEPSNGQRSDPDDQ